MYILSIAILRNFDPLIRKQAMLWLARALLLSFLIAIAVTTLLTGFFGETLFVLQLACLGFIWFTGIRALTLWVRSSRNRTPEVSPAPKLRVALLYCTADDLNPEKLAQSAAQNVPVDIYILDDSAGYESRRDVDTVAARIGAQVIRRDHRTDAKAGNLNNALAQIDSRTDAVVILDNDTEIPHDFVSRTTAVLTSDPRIGCVQAAPIDEGASWFAKFFGPLVDTHARINHATRARIGFALFGGRGALVSLPALREVGGFPTAVAEDLALSVRLRAAGWQIVHRPDIEFREEFPIDYAAFRVQQGKAAEGAAEFLLGNHARTLSRRERWDVVLETSLLPVGALVGLIALAVGSTLAIWGKPTPIAFMVITSVLALAPLLPEAVRRLRQGEPVSAALFLVLAPMLYASVSLAVVRHTARILRGNRARFIITPRTGSRLTLGEAVSALSIEYTWAVTAVMVTAVLGMPLLSIPFTLPALVATAMLLLGTRDPLTLVRRPARAVTVNA
jgi:cellulose synthase/poly-beta-1,6-N-acetylglucosamine synthase-like glycosyltransferase